MLSAFQKNFIEVARLGLRGDRNILFRFLQELAIKEINKNHHEIYHVINKLLREENLLHPETSSVEKNIKNIAENTIQVNTSNIWLSPILQKRIGRILEYLKKTNGQANRNFKRILMFGPPGTGKTTLGFYIASQLKLPIRYVKITDLLSSKLGETMKNMANVFHAPGREIIFIDEFDAFAKSRQDTNEVGELKRIVNSMIQTLDFGSSEKIIIVATNLIDSIDPAILRRFPFKIEVGPLNEKEKKDFFKHLIKHDKEGKAELTNAEWSFLFDVFNMLGLNTIDELLGVAEKAEVEMTLANRKTLTYFDFLEVLFTDGYLSELKQIKKKNKKLLATLLQQFQSLGYSQSYISSTLGIHRNTYPKYVS